MKGRGRLALGVGAVALLLGSLALISRDTAKQNYSPSLSSPSSASPGGLTPASGYRIKMGLQKPEYLETEAGLEATAMREASSRFTAPSHEMMGSPSTFSFSAANEYGVYPQHSRKLYGYDHVMEPHKETTFSAVGKENVAACCSVEMYWSLRKLTIDADDDVITATVVETHFGDTFKFTAKGPNEWYSLTLVETMVDKKSNVMKLQRSYTSSAIVTKFVRRELRALSDSDREAIFVREIYYDRVHK
jgi:hypothetical protein